MGNHSSDSQKGRKPHNDSGLLILPNPIYNNSSPIKPSKKRMARIIIDYLFPSAYGLVLLLNVGDVKGLILFVIAVLYGAARLFFYIVRQNQDRRMRELDIQEKKRSLQH